MSKMAPERVWRRTKIISSIPRWEWGWEGERGAGMGGKGGMSWVGVSARGSRANELQTAPLRITVAPVTPRRVSIHACPHELGQGMGTSSYQK